MSIKIPAKVEKTLNTADKIYRGCLWIAVNFFVMLFLCWSLYSTVVGLRVETNGVSVEGYVVDQKTSSDGSVSAVVEFSVNGQTHRFEDDAASIPPRYELGQKVTVLYDRSDPSIARIDDRAPTWLFPACGLMTTFLALIGINIWGVRAWKRGEEIIDL